jgi:hypothetical protein
MPNRFLRIVLFCAIAYSCEAQFSQQGNKLVGSGANGIAEQGSSVAVSSDGNTAIVGGPFDNGGIGAAWIFTRSGGVWTQQDSKLVGSGAVGSAYEGTSVALSADGNTAIIGANSDNNYVGAAWVFTRSGGVWTQQGSKLVGTGAAGAPDMGSGVALSSDGNTAIIGGYYDNGGIGASWIFTRSNGVWAQQGGKLVGTGAVGTSFQGISVALSADGNTAFIGGEGDNNHAGAGWIFTQSGGLWSQQGSKLVGAGAIGSAFQGDSVALSADGNTAIIGGHDDNSNLGAVWVFTRSGGLWSQQGSKLVGTGAVGLGGGNFSAQGSSVALSADGNTAIIGGDADNDLLGAVWVFTRLGGAWSQQGSKLVGTGAVPGSRGTYEGASLALSADGSTAIIGGSQDNTAAGAVWVFTRSCQISLPSVSQEGNPAVAAPLPNTWGLLPYNQVAGATIAGRGSALTSMDMALNQAGESWSDPGMLNTFFNSNGGYGPGGNIEWLAATASTNPTNSSSPIIFDTLGGWTNSDVNLSSAIQTVESSLCATPSVPVIVGVRSPATGNYPGHFVLVTGEIVNQDDGSKALTINDPYYSAGIIGSDHAAGVSGYTNSQGAPEFWTRGSVHDPAILAGLSVTANAVGNLMVTDPNGLQSGFATGNSEPLQNIPKSGAGIDEIDDDVTAATGSPMEAVVINSPTPGAFQISLTGTASAPYTLRVVAEASDGSVQSFVASGTAAAGATTTYGMTYGGTPGGAAISTINGSPVSACDIDYQGNTGVADVQSEINEALGAASASNDLNGDGVVNVLDVQIVLDAALHLGCAAR